MTPDVVTCTEMYSFCPVCSGDEPNFWIGHKMDPRQKLGSIRITWRV